MPRVIVLASPELIADIITHGTPGLTPAPPCVIPSDAKLVGSGYDHDRQQFVLVFEHDMFPETTSGERLPIWRPVFNKTDVVAKVQALSDKFGYTIRVSPLIGPSRDEPAILTSLVIEMLRNERD